MRRRGGGATHLTAGAPRVIPRVVYFARVVYFVGGDAAGWLALESCWMYRAVN
jgi:hypothetical protein